MPVRTDHSMIVILPLILAMIALALLLTVGALALAAGATNAALNLTNDKTRSNKVKPIMIIGGLISFVIVWFQLGPVDSGGIDGPVESIFKVAISALAGAITVFCAALFLRGVVFTQNTETLSDHLTAFAVVGVMFGSLTTAMISYIFTEATEGPAPVALSLDGTPTHCVTGDVLLTSNTKLRDHTNIIILKLKQGDRVRIEPYTVFSRQGHRMHAMTLVNENGSRIVYTRPNRIRPIEEVPDC